MKKNIKTNNEEEDDEGRKKEVAKDLEEENSY